MNFDSYKKYCKSLKDPKEILLRLVQDTERYVKESLEKWNVLNNSSLLTTDYISEIKYDKIEAESMRIRQEWLVNYISNKYGEDLKGPLLNLIISIERLEREKGYKSLIKDRNDMEFNKGISYLEEEKDAMNERKQTWFDYILNEMIKREPSEEADEKDSKK